MVQGDGEPDMSRLLMRMRKNTLWSAGCRFYTEFNKFELTIIKWR